MNIILSLYNLFNTSKKKKIWDTTTWNQLLFYNALKKTLNAHFKVSARANT